MHFIDWVRNEAFLCTFCLKLPWIFIFLNKTFKSCFACLTWLLKCLKGHFALTLDSKEINFILKTLKLLVSHLNDRNKPFGPKLE